MCIQFYIYTFYPIYTSRWYVRNDVRKSCVRVGITRSNASGGFFPRKSWGSLGNDPAIGFQRGIPCLEHSASCDGSKKYWAPYRNWPWEELEQIQQIYREFPIIGVPPVIILFNGMFPKNHPFLGTPILGHPQNRGYNWLNEILK